jgi:FkbM family methyltransferase
VSYAQNGEDVVLWRALHAVPEGRYVEVGANDPTTHSISKAFYDRGWSGVAIEPVPALAAAFREARPRDTVVEAAITAEDIDTVQLHLIEDTGLSTLRDDIGAEHASSGWAVEDVTVAARRLDAVLDEHVGTAEDVHFLVIDTEGGERKVLESIDLARWRPWVLVIEATAPMSDRRTHDEWEDLVLAAGYDFVMFDGLSRWYVAKERSDLVPALDHPACALDLWVSRSTYEARQRADALEAERNALVDQLVRWRGVVLDRWAQAAAAAVGNPGAGGVPTHESARLLAELDAMRRTVSWRITAPLRDIRASQLRRSRRV